MAVRLLAASVDDNRRLWRRSWTSVVEPARSSQSNSFCVGSLIRDLAPPV